MKKTVYALLLVLIALLILLLFYSVDKRNETLFPETEKKIGSKEVSAEDNRDLYILTLEGERLNLYLGEDKTAPFESEIVRKEVFPKDDVARLKKGMVFENREDAYIAMENFVN